MRARDRYRVRVLPAGADDRMVEVSGPEGEVKYLYCPHPLAGEAAGREEEIRRDLEALDAEAFAKKYGI